MTTNEIISTVRNKILEKGTEVIDDTQLMIYLNLCYQKTVKKIFPKRTVKTVVVPFTNGVGTMPTDFGTFYTDSMDVHGNPYPEMSLADFIRAGGQYAVCIDNGQFKATNSFTGNLTMYYYPGYPALTTAVNPTIPSDFHEALVYGTTARAMQDLQDPELATYYDNMYKSEVKDASDDLSNYDEDAQRGGQMFNGIQVVSNSNGMNNPDKW